MVLPLVVALGLGSGDFSSKDVDVANGDVLSVVRPVGDGVLPFLLSTGGTEVPPVWPVLPLLQWTRQSQVAEGWSPLLLSLANFYWAILPKLTMSSKTDPADGFISGHKRSPWLRSTLSGSEIVPAGLPWSKYKAHISFMFCNREETMKTTKMSAMASPFKIPEAPAELENDTPQHETPGFLLLLCPQNAPLCKRVTHPWAKSQICEDSFFFLSSCSSF